jgi:type IV fimbrial biogenesis protein FimT
MYNGLWRSEQGFTLPELIIVIVLMGIVLAIASSSWFEAVESRRVTSATNQVVADMRLAHTSATNRLGTAKIIFSNQGNTITCNGVSANYCLVVPVVGGTQSKPRTLPSNTVVSSPNLLPDVAGGTTSTILFASDGSATTVGSLGVVSSASCPAGTPSGTARIRVASDDGNPAHCITFNTTTSRIRVD